jgi:hypothetical protein
VRVAERWPVQRLVDIGAADVEAAEGPIGWGLRASDVDAVRCGAQTVVEAPEGGPEHADLGARHCGHPAVHPGHHAPHLANPAVLGGH